MPHTTSKYTRKEAKKEARGRRRANRGRANERTDTTLVFYEPQTHITNQRVSYWMAGGVGVTTGCYYYCVAGLGNICDQITCIGKALVF